MLDQHSQALEYYDQAINIDPSNEMFYNNRGLSYEHLGDCEQALSDYQTALTINPDYQIAKDNIEYVRVNCQ